MQIFISYSGRDLDTAISLETAISNQKQLIAWRDQTRFPIGQEFVKNIWAGLRESHCLVAIATTSWLQSYWCQRELAAALRLRKLEQLRMVLALRSYPSLFKPRWTNRSTHSVAKAITILDTQVRRQERRRAAAAEPTHNLDIGTLPPAGEKYFGRSDAFRVIDEWLFGGKPPGLWIHGGGGIGKSSLVNTWLTAATTIGYRDPLSFHVLGHSFYDENIDVFEERLMAWAPSSNASSIIILDGVERVASGIAFSRLKDLCKRRRVIATSRETPPSELGLYFRLLPLRQLDQRESELVLGLTHTDAQTVMKRLEGLPLALTLAAAYLKRSPDVKSYVRRLDEVAEGKVATTKKVATALERIETELRQIGDSPGSSAGEHALAFLYVLSVANEPTPKDRVRSLLKSRELPTTAVSIANATEDQIEEAIRLLEQRGLVSVSGEMIEIHRLVREYFRERQRR